MEQFIGRKMILGQKQSRLLIVQEVKTIEKKRKVAHYTADKKQYHVYVDRLVAQAFIPGETKYGVTHIDGNSLNCKLENLRWRTKKDTQTVLKNNLYQFPKCVVCHKHGTKDPQSVCSSCLIAFARGRKNSKALKKRKNELSKLYSLDLNEEQKKIINMRIQGMTLQQIANDFGMTREGVRIKMKTLLNRYSKLEKELKELKKPDEKSMYLMSLSEACKYLNVSRPILYRMLDVEGLPYIEIGKRKKVLKKDAYNWIKQNTLINEKTME